MGNRLAKSVKEGDSSLPPLPTVGISYQRPKLHFLFLIKKTSQCSSTETWKQHQQVGLILLPLLSVIHLKGIKLISGQQLETISLILLFPMQIAVYTPKSTNFCRKHSSTLSPLPPRECLWKKEIGWSFSGECFSRFWY